MVNDVVDRFHDIPYGYLLVSKAIVITFIDCMLVIFILAAVFS